MMRRALASSLMLLLALPACNGADAEARKLWDRAAADVAAGRAREAVSWAEALARYEQAEAAVQQVRTRYEDTATGSAAGTPSTMLGPVAIGLFEGTILPAVRVRAEAEADPVACAAYLAEHVGPPLPRVRALAAVAADAARLSDATSAERALAAAEATAAGLPTGSPARTEAYAAVADALIAANELERAHAMILAHGLGDAWQRLAAARAAAKAADQARGMVAHAVGGEPPARAEARLTIAQALWKAGDFAAAKALMIEAEALVEASPPADQPRLGRAVATAYAAQAAVAQAEAWLAKAGGLADATQPELDALVAAYTGAHVEEKLRARAHADLTVLAAGTDQDAAVEVPWLANAAYVQGKLGEREPAAFALARARLLADGIAPADAPAALPAELAALRGVAERLAALGQADPAREALADAEARLAALPRAKADAERAATALTAARLADPPRALALVGAVTDPATLATALAACAAATDGALSATPVELHALIARVDPGAPGLTAPSPTPVAGRSPLVLAPDEVTSP